MMKQLENQLKRVNPEVYKEFQEARKNNADPNEYLNRVVSGFSPEQKQQWNMLMGQFNNKQ